MVRQKNSKETVGPPSIIFVRIFEKELQAPDLQIPKLLLPKLGEKITVSLKETDISHKELEDVEIGEVIHVDFPYYRKMYKLKATVLRKYAQTIVPSTSGLINRNN